MTSRPLSIAILACAGWAAATQALALGFGRLPESAVFGQALDLAVPLQLEPGESLAPGCVQAEVQVGEQRLPPQALQLTLERHGAARDDWRVRLRSAQVVHEPLVAVNLAVGCNGPVSRQFVVFADPPHTPPAAATPVVQAEALAPAPVPRVSARTVARHSVAEGTRKPSKAGARTVAARKPAEPVAPRLTLDEPEERLKAAMLVVAAQDAARASAAQAASAAAAAASAAEQRLLAMEAELKALRDEAAGRRSAMEQMRQRVAQAEDQGRMQSVLAGVVVALALLALWLGWRVRALQRERQAAWWQAAAAAQEPAMPLLDPAVAPLGPEPVPPPAPEPADMPPSQRSAALPQVALAEESLTRPVSVDELIDLEQQADFFLVLGEEDAAVDLLMSHLRGTGGTSPLPYLKLLEIYRRREDHEAHERLRRRFGQRFNAVAPQWEADPERGRELQDYPEVLAVLQAAWPQPLDAMAELENLLFRKRSGELFELPAYRDVLTLYSVARDLHRQQDRPAADVDVLLPLATGEAAAPSIFDNLDSDYPEGVAEDRPTAPVDLDLSEAAAAVRADLR